METATVERGNLPAGFVSAFGSVVRTVYGGAAERSRCPCIVFVVRRSESSYVLIGWSPADNHRQQDNGAYSVACRRGYYGNRNALLYETEADAVAMAETLRDARCVWHNDGRGNVMTPSEDAWNAGNGVLWVKPSGTNKSWREHLQTETDTGCGREPERFRLDDNGIACRVADIFTRGRKRKSAA